MTRKCREAVVVVSAVEYARLTRPKESLIDFLQRSPLAEVDLDLSRSGDSGRGIDL